MRILRTTAALCALALASACGSEPPAKPPEAAQNPPEPSVPPEIQSATSAVLGGETEVLLFGDLARTGQQQVFAVNRIRKAPPNTVPGTLILRATILGKEGEKWTELLHVDEHLKNTNGFLAATPVAPVTGWRVQYEQDAVKGLELYFTPLQKPAGGTLQTIEVRWNSKVKRYQSLDRNFDNFLGESPTLEKIGRYLH